MEYLAKSSGITLQEHVDNVVAEGQKIIDSYPFVIEKYKKVTGRDLAKRLEGACLFHDEGKKHKRWQSACQKDYQIFLYWQKANGGTFKDFETKVKRTGKNLMQAKVRHEVDSVVRHPNLPLPTQVAIGAHHRKLSKYHEHKWVGEVWKIKGGKEAWEKFELLNNEYILESSFAFRKILKRHYEFAGIRGLLQLADQRASIAENDAFIPDYIPFEYSFKHTKRRSVQQIAEDNWKDDLLLLRAPTGAGKTDASLLWAKKQIDNEKADRLIIAMPTRFTSNALAINVTDTLSDTGLYHSSAWFQKFHEEAKESKAKHKARMYHEFARRLQTPVTVCTIDHLLMCFTLSREDHHAIAFNLAHSCVVIDEADFYDEFTQANILVLLEALHELKVPVLIMSASLPKSSLKMYQSTGFNVTEIKEDKSDNERPRCEVKARLDYETADDVSELLLKCTRKPAIIYANTVAKAVEFYDWFIENTEIKPVLYHSRFTEPHKLLKEEELLDHLGKKAWENATANGVAILTQIGEMSVNISADLMISDICPIDRLVQRAGRLCRFDKEKVGELYVLLPHQTRENKKTREISKNIYPAPYGTYDKRSFKWEMNEALEKTIELLKLKKYSAGDFVEFINEVYHELEDFSVCAKENAKLLKENFACNWVILPHAASEVDDTGTVFWKSRNIANNVSVLTEFPKNPYFNNYMDWQAFKNEHSVDLSRYLVPQGIDSSKIDSNKWIYIKEEKIPVYVTYLDIYTIGRGLYWKKQTATRIEDQFL